ncbi:MAG: hypothetical protein HOE48_24510 [Candidatus Latescibacteria bacterium]|nr:hypothetical protein [Candidatus Latescibacterota bacterium]
MIIEHPRILKTETVLANSAPIYIAAPRSKHGQQVAKRIRAALQNKGIQSEILPDPAGEFLTTANGPTIVVGNLADSHCIQTLYYRFLCATDLWYPGPGGYELRTLCDPLGSGHNIILIGYSDAEGAQEGCDVFISQLGHSIPHLKTLKVTRLPLSDDETKTFRTEPLPDVAWQVANTTLGDSKGYLYYLTGEPEVGEAYRKSWQALIACGYEKNDKLVQTHLYSLTRILPWRLVEDMDLFSTEERLAITQFIYGWAESEEGWQYVAQCQRGQSPHVPRQNHELIPALSLTVAADYFETHLPKLSGPKRWRTAARPVHEVYGSSWKPLCDGLCHGWWMSQPVMLAHALHDPTHQYFEQGGAHQAAECAMAVVNNSGWLPTAGDGDLRRQFPGPSLRAAAAYYQDGRFRFVHDLAPPNRHFASLTTPPRAFDIGIKPQVPKDMIGVTVIPIDPLVYHVWARDPTMAPLVATRAPSAPIDQCFDKLAVRTGWTLTDDYLLIDGLGGGSHSYDDAGGILEYARLGISLIVQEDNFVHSAPEHHSSVTIVQNGETGLIPGFAILEAQETDATGTIYLRLRLREYAGADWVREVHVFPNRCAVFVDTVTANEPGDFAVEAHFRTPTQLTLKDCEAQGKRMSPCVDNVDVRIESLCEPSHLSLAEIPVHLRYKKEDDHALWKERYCTDEMLLTAFTAREATHLKAGESVRLIHLVQGCAPKETPIHLSQTETDIFISNGKIQEPLKSFKIKHPKPKTAKRLQSKETPRANAFFDAKDQITAHCLLRDGSIAVGTQTGTINLVNAEGNSVWAKKLEGPIHDIGVAQGESTLLAAGHGPASLTGVDHTGEHLWTTTIEREPCPWPWWELSTPAAIQVAGGMCEGEPFFAVGCGDIQMRCFNKKGLERWRWRYNEGVPGRVRVADIEGSGNPKIVVGGDILSDQSTCRILSPNGDLTAELRVEGWTSMLTALAFGQCGERHFIGCGASRGTNLHLFEHKNNSWHQSWQKQPGGQVTGIYIHGTEDRIWAKTSQGFLLCYNLTGEPIWHHLFDRGIQHLKPLKEGLLVSDDSGKLWTVDFKGNVEEQAPLPAPCSFATANDAGVYLVSGSKIKCFTL